MTTKSEQAAPDRAARQTGAAGPGAAAATGPDQAGSPGHEPGPASAHGDKLSILTKGRASVVSSIADAVVVKAGDMFFVVPADGSVPCRPGHGFGLYFHDCRFLNGYELRIGGQPAEPLAATAAEGASARLELTTPEIELTGGKRIPKEQVGISWSRAIDGQALVLRDEIAFRNYGLETVQLPVSLAFGAAFEDVFAIRGLLEEYPGKVGQPRWQDDALVLSYEGADGIERSTAIRFDRKMRREGNDSAVFTLDVAARATETIRVSIEVSEARRDARGGPDRDGRGGEDRNGRHSEDRNGRPGESGDARRRHGDEMSAWLEGQTHFESDSLIFNGVVERSLRDLRTLLSGPQGQQYFAAGVPWFVTLFGRDALTTALQTLAFDPGIAAQTLHTVAALQGTRVDDWRDEQPGKMLHSVRQGELAHLNRIPHTPFYGSVDATPLFLIVLARHAEWTGSLDLFEELRDHVASALDWLRAYGDVSGHGWLEYDSPKAPNGLINQGWKDSGNAIVDGAGAIARPPIALVELQGYAFAARLAAASLYRRAGDAQKAEQLEGEAEALRKRFEAAFWRADEGCYDMALQGGTDGTKVVSSNAGHVLWTGIASAGRAGSSVDRLMQPDMFSGWGIRTLSSHERRYDPIGYHLGTVWPHDTGLIADGFRRYGHDDEALRLAEGLIEAAADFPHSRLPEVFAGFDRSEFGAPVRYPVACHPQAWAAGSMTHLVATLLGLEPHGFERRLRLVRPRLPAFVHRLELGRLRVGDAEADLRVSRTERGTRVEVLAVRGDLDVEVSEASDARHDPDPVDVGTTEGSGGAS